MKIRKFTPFNNGSHGKNLGWYYTQYNSETEEGVGFFGTPEEIQYCFRDKIVNGYIREIGLGDSDFIKRKVGVFG